MNSNSTQFLEPTSITKCKDDSLSVVSLPTSRNGSFSYHQPTQSNQQPIVHRCRFTDYTPGTITAIAASPLTWQSKSQLNTSYPSSDQDYLHPSASNSHRAVLAVGRGNGDIQIWTWINANHVSATKRDTPLPTYQHKKKPISSSQAWSLYRTLPGHTPSDLNQNSSSNHHSNAKVEHLVFAHQIVPSDLDQSDPDHDKIKEMTRKLPRLLGSNGADEVIEWVWEGPLAGTIKRTLQMPPLVAIWSLSVSPGSTRLAVGCGDGRIRIANIADDQLELIRVLDPCKTRILSLSWAIQESPSSVHEGKSVEYPMEPPDSQLFIVAGCADSSLRKWAVSSRRCLNRMTVEKLQGEQTLVWSVTVIDGTIVSGDSLGNVHFWDLKTCSRRQTIRAHRADVLCIRASADGQTVFTSGVDQKTCQLGLNIQQRAQKTGKISESRWLLSASRRLHSHDVRALEISPPYNPLFFNSSSSPDHSTNSSFSSNLVQNIRSMVPVLISGGLDMSLVFCPAAPPPSKLEDNKKMNYNILSNPISDSYSVSFADSMPRKISYVINRDPVASIAHDANLLVCRNSKRISIWRLKSPNSQDLDLMVHQKSSAVHADDEAWAKVLEMDLKCRTNLISSAISSDGRWLAVSDLYEVKLFCLNKLEDGTLQPRRMKGFQGFGSLNNVKSRNQGARSIEFSTDSVRLVLVGSLTSDLVVIGLDYSDRNPSVKILRVFYQHFTLIHQLNHLNRSVITPSSCNPTANVSSENPNLDDQNNLPSQNHHLPNSEVDQDVYVMKMTMSPDGQWLATADSTRTLHIYNMDALKHHCYLPIPAHLVNSLAFPPSMPSVLVIGFANNTIQVIDVESRRVPEWARELNGNRPESLLDIRDSMIGMAFQPLRIHVDQNNNKSRSNSILPPDDRSMTIDENESNHQVGMIDSPIDAFHNHQLKLQSSTKLNPNNKSVVGLIWGANWVCKMTIPDPNQLVPNLNQSQHLQPLITRDKKRRLNGLDLPVHPGPQPSSTSEENQRLKFPIEKQTKSIVKSNGDKKSHEIIKRKHAPNHPKKDEQKGKKNGICEVVKMTIDDAEDQNEDEDEFKKESICVGDEELFNKILAEAESKEGGGEGSEVGRLISPSFQISHKFQSILAIDYFNNNQLVVVERPFFSFIFENLLPPAWHRVGAYGT